SANVPCAGCCGEQQYTGLRFHFPGIPANASGIRMSCADRRRFFPRCRARFFAVRRTASGSPENRDSGVARPEGPASSGESCHAVLQDEEEGHLPAIPRSQSWHRSDNWLPPAEKRLYSIVLSCRFEGGICAKSERRSR